ncbi:alpha/beta hydrolase family protein [Paenibacillus sp. FSL K6-2862]|uniref:alpha/beta hydrolase family protein n=1 Tax=Paenibacillus sp. FSL K6-2862 TaxID=2921484 RepID=UPI0030FCB028
MRKMIKIVGISILIVILLIVGLKIKNTLFPSRDDSSELDMDKIFAQQAQSQGDIPPLENIEQRTIDIKYINKDSIVDTRQLRLYIPEDTEQPMPLIYVPHYEMTEDALELGKYLAEGWMVASPTNFDNKYNGQLTDDDLVFNNAALYTLRHMEEVDHERIALIGGSAGGYTTLMLNALQMGINASIANSPITNVYFNFYQYFPEGNKVNDNMGWVMLKGFFKMITAGDNGEKEMLKTMMDLPIPFLGMLSGMFDPILENFPDKEDIARWEAFSPVGLTDYFSSPMVINHVTSDVLVPIDQISRRFTYEENGNSMPDGFSTRLDSSNPGVLGHSLEEELPSELTRTEHIMITDPDKDSILPYDSKKPFNLNIYDDGTVESYGSHRATSGTGVTDDIPYLRDMFSRSLAETEMLMPRKLLLLLDRYQGRSVQLPAHEGMDDTVYGSLVIYQQEVVEELSQWAKNHSMDELNHFVQNSITNIEDEAAKNRYADAWRKIKVELSQM